MLLYLKYEQAKELLAELVMVEEEIARLEGEIGKIQQNISDEQELRTKYRRKNDDDDKFDMSARIMSQASDQHSASFNQSSRITSFHEKVTLETKPMFFINQAINGGYIMHGFNNKVKKEIAEKKENQRFRLKKSEIVVENQSSPKLLLPRQHITKVSKIRLFFPEVLWNVFRNNVDHDCAGFSRQLSQEKYSEFASKQIIGKYHEMFDLRFSEVVENNKDIRD